MTINDKITAFKAEQVFGFGERERGLRIATAGLRLLNMQRRAGRRWAESASQADLQRVAVYCNQCPHRKQDDALSYDDWRASGNALAGRTMTDSELATFWTGVLGYEVLGPFDIYWFMVSVETVGYCIQKGLPIEDWQ
jgi:hypothetical protein